MATGKAQAKATGTCWQRGLRPGRARERSCAKGFEAGPHFGIKGWQGSCVEGWGRDPGWVRYFAKAGAFPQQQQPGLGVIQVPQGFQKRLARINPLGLGVGRAKSMAPNGGPQQSKSSGPVNCKPCREAVWVNQAVVGCCDELALGWVERQADLAGRYFCLILLFEVGLVGTPFGETPKTHAAGCEL